MTVERRLARAFLERYPRKAAERVDLAPAQAAAQLLDGCGAERIARLLQHVDPAHAGRIIAALPGAGRAELLAALPPGRAALILQDTPSDTREAWLALLSDELARPLRAALAHPPDTTARVMDPAVLAAPAETTAGRARQLVARHADRALYYLYVIDELRRPVGVLNLRELMRASARTPLSTLMHAPVLTVPSRSSLTVLAAHPGWRDLHALPVVDNEGVLVGVVRYETGARVRAEAEGHASTGSVGVALTEAMWTLAAHLVDELADAAGRPDRRHE